MSTTLTGRAPRNDPEWARDISQRLRRLEQSTAVRVGQWSLTERAGQLIASKPGEVAALGQQVEATVLNLSNYATKTDIAALAKTLSESLKLDLGALQGLEPLAQIARWATQVGKQIVDAVQLSPLVQAITGLAGGLTDLANWANLVPRLIGAGSTLLTSWIPGLDASKIISGVIPQSLLDLSSIAASAVSGVLTAANIPGLDAAKIVSGVLSGSLIPNLPASIINSGTFTTSLIPNLNASIINAGTLLTSVIPGLDASKITTGTFATGLIPTITAAMSSGLAPIDTLVNAWGLAGTGWTPTDLGNIARLIPPANMVGVLGGTDIGNTIQKVVDAGVAAINNLPATVNNTVAQFRGALNGMTNFVGYVTTGSAPVNSVAQISSATQDLVKQRAIQKATYANLDPTLDASFDLAEINTISTLPTIPVTQTKSAIAYITARDGGIKQSVSWMGYGVTNISEFYVNVGTVNKTTGVFTTIYSSVNIIAGVGTGSVPVWNSLNLPALNYINTTSGDKLAIEFNIRGTGTYNLVGKTLSSQLPVHPTAVTAFPGAARSIDAAPSVTNVAAARTTAVNTPNPVTFNITVGPDDNAVVVGINAYQVSTVSASITVGGNAMTLIGSAYNYAANSYIYWYGYQFTPGTFTGSKTVSFSYTGGSWLLELQAWSMKNVSTFGTPVGTAANSSSISQTIASSSTQYLLNIMAQNTTGNNITAYNKTARTNYTWSSGAVVPFQSGDVVGSSSVTFTATVTGGGGWGSVILPVNGVILQPPTTLANPVASGAPMTWDAKVAWCGLSGSAGITQYSPVITPMMDVAAMSYTPPSWANFFDIVIWPGGASGTSGAGLVGGFGGNASTPTVVTLTKAQISGANWTWTNGSGGAATSPYGVPGNNGAQSNVVVPGYGTITATGVGTGNGSTSGAVGLPGGTAASATVGGNYYPGGSGGGSPQANGSQPGGGGAGGNATYMTYVGGGAGGYGGGYICARQT